MSNIKQLITEIAFELGFDAVGIASAEELKSSNNHFLEWREAGYAADMSYLLRENPINAKPKEIVKEAKTIISLLVNYYTKPPENPGVGFARVASYAVGKDYHNVLKRKVKQFQEKLKKELSGEFVSRGFSDAVPLLEKSFGKESGLGFMGKHTLLINKPFGSYFFLSEIISNVEVEPDKETVGTCGKCTRCIDVCPTGALDVGVYHGKPLLDARLCISYLTIENKGIIPVELREKIGNWIFGCDLCQIACPYNNTKDKKIKETNWDEFKPESGIGHWISLKEVLSIRNDLEFINKFAGTALMRSKRKGLLRNAVVVAGNNLSEEVLPELIWLAENEPDQIIREHVLWALSKFGIISDVSRAHCEYAH